MDVLANRSTQQADRYYKYILSSRMTTGKFKFQLPSVNQNQFSNEYKSALCRITRIYVNEGDNDKNGLSVSNGTAKVFPLGGMAVRTNLISRNYVNLTDNSSGAVQPIISATGDQNRANQRYGVILGLNGQATSTVALSNGYEFFTFDDPRSSIFDSGVPVAVPFGQVLEFSLEEATMNTAGGFQQLFFYEDDGGAGNLGTPNGAITFEIEFYLLD